MTCVTHSLQQWLTDNDIPSFSPRIGSLLIGIASAIKDKLHPTEDQELNEQIVRYLFSLHEVGTVGALHQKAVIDKLASLMESRDQ